MVNQNLPSIQNGSVVASVKLQGSVIFYDIYGGDTIKMSGTLGSGVAVNPTYNTIPIAGVPGLGLRVRWQSIVMQEGSPTTPSFVSTSIKPAGTPIVGMWQEVASVRLSGTPSTRYTYVTVLGIWLYELVVTNDRLYIGGTVSFSGVNTMGVVSNGNQQACSPTAIWGTAYLGTSLPVPELPKPPTATCIFDTGTLTQTVNMNEASTTNVPAVTDLRAAGSETPFTITAYQCGENTFFDLYFTDGAASGAQKSYLNPTVGSTIGVRLYYHNDGMPVEFGPAPNGSNTPPQRPVSVGPVQGTANVPFYAQYARVPGVEASEVVPGSIGAMATVTVVYP